MIYRKTKNKTPKAHLPAKNTKDYFIDCGTPDHATLAYMAMFRYAFGRMTYMPGVVMDIIKHNVESGPLADIAPNDATPTITPQLRDFFSYTAKEIADACSCNSNSGEASPVIVLNPPYGKRLDFDAPKLYTQIGRRLAELSRDLTPFGKQLTVAILAPKDDNRPGSKYTCTANLLHECPALAPQQNPVAKCIATSHGGFSLNVFIAKI